MRIICSIIATALSLTAASALAKTHEVASKVITANEPTAQIAQNQKDKDNATLIILNLQNSGSSPHALIAAACPVAEQTELHMGNKNGKTMRRVQSVSIKPGSKAKSSDTHLMLMGMKNPARMNQKIECTLIFNDGSWMQIDSRVSEKPLSMKNDKKGLKR